MGAMPFGMEGASAMATTIARTKIPEIEVG